MTDDLPKEVRLKENRKTPWNYSLVSRLLPKMKILSILARNYYRLDIKLFLYYTAIRQSLKKCDRCYYKMWQLLYCKMRQKFIYKMCQTFYYKMQQLLQIATILLKNAAVITKCDVC